MMEEHLHVADEELLLHASGELSAGRSGQVSAHLGCCSNCRARLKELERTLAEVGEAYFNSHDAALPSGNGSRAVLTARIAELAASRHGNGLRSSWKTFLESHRAVVFAGAAVAACLLLAIRVYGPGGGSQPAWTSLAVREEPNLRLTPGATDPVSTSEICGGATTRTAPVVPVSLKRKVFELYGVTPPRPDAYEVDYLITPELGGATDIRNLWPEPYQDTVWNAHVKDQLEDRLHRMVCSGDVDLATAQRDISTDWIAAYRKYFHADRPVEGGSSSNSFNVRGPVS
jgi:hypothetical protein